MTDKGVGLSSEQRDRAARVKRTVADAKDTTDNSAVANRAKAWRKVQPVSAIYAMLSDQCPDCTPNALLAATLELSGREQPHD